jgi:O-antigen ligase
LLGAGYGAFWNRRVLAIMRERFSWGPGQSHNGYIEVYAQLGLVGLSIFGVVVLSSVRHAVRLCFKNFELGRWRIVLLICVLFQNLAEAGFPRPTHLMWFTFLIVAVNSFPRRVIDSRKQNIYRTPSIESQARQTPGQATHAFMRVGSGLQERRYVGALLHV